MRYLSYPLLLTACLGVNTVAYAYEVHSDRVVEYEPIPTVEYLESKRYLAREEKRLNILLGFEASYIYPTASSFHFGDKEASTLNMKPSQTTGFRVFGNVFFNERKNDIGFSWFTYRSKNTSSRDGEDFYIPESPTWDTMPLGPFESLDGRFDISNNVINLEYGFHLDEGTDGKLLSRVHTGIQYANIKVNQDSFGTNPGPAPNNASLQTESKYDGVGPRIGIDTFYTFDNGFILSGRAATSLLFGNIKWQQDIKCGSDSLSSDNKSSRVVPSIDAQFTGGYVINIHPTQIMLEGGYQLATFFNAYRDTQFDKRDITSHGPFVGIRLIT